MAYEMHARMPFPVTEPKSLYEIPKFTVDGPPVEAGTEVTVTLRGRVINGPTCDSPQRLRPEDWRGPTPVDGQPVDVDALRHELAETSRALGDLVGRLWRLPVEQRTMVFAELPEGAVKPDDDFRATVASMVGLPWNADEEKVLARVMDGSRAIDRAKPPTKAEVKMLHQIAKGKPVGVAPADIATSASLIRRGWITSTGAVDRFNLTAEGRSNG